MNKSGLNHLLGLLLCVFWVSQGGCTQDPAGQDCDPPCVEGANMITVCVAGQCSYTCLTGFLDCNDDPSDGCEREGLPFCPTATEVDCTDGWDNDEDGAIDCDDDDCGPEHCAGVEYVCADGQDNDFDGQTDCDDDDCATSPMCAPETDCADGWDNDSDGDIDCDDADCATDPLCLPETDCADSVDNDGDGDTDCDDADCASLPLCAPACPTFDLGNATGDGVATGDSTGYGDDFASTSGCGDGASSGEDIAFAWTPFTSGCFQIDTDQSDYDTVLRVHDGCAGALVRCDDDGGGGTTSRLNLEAGAGVTYIIVVDGHAAGDAGTYVLDINYLGPGCP